jgi:GntR family transcriptional repressor for pyruvate dehydrogenase complex
MTEYSKLRMEPIQKTDVYREVIDRISHLIYSGGYAPGDRLPSERELSELLGVSRTTLRQGIKVLESMGRVETRVGSGTYVCPDHLPQICIQDIEVSKKGVADLITARCGIETTVITSFMDDHRTEENVARLAAHVSERAEQTKETLRQRSTSYKYNFQFEEMIAEMTGNQILILQQQQVHALWTYLWGKLGFLPRVGNATPQHTLILSAIQDDDKELACIYMQRHVQRDLEELFKS